jgi:uncharacterized membrane protein YgdD (TMEM256/DUF423 family)
MLLPWLKTGALFSMLGVAAGAFGAHGLKATLSPELMAIYQTGVDYHLFHALAVVALSLAPIEGIRPALWLLTAGIVVFSGSLYLLALTDTRWLGAITPFGGVSFMLGWLLVVLRAKPAVREP